MIDKKIAFIGTGFMAGAMINGLLESETFKNENITAINDAEPDAADQFAKKYNISHGGMHDIDSSDIVLFAVKPQNFMNVIEMYGDHFSYDKIYFSIMAGVSTSAIEIAISSVLEKKTAYSTSDLIKSKSCNFDPDNALESSERLQVIRFMPNLALSVGLSATVYSLGKYADSDAAYLAEAIFSPLGIIKRVNESEISQVTALSGSGPAYFYLLTESMTEAAVSSGMDPVLASELAVQTFIGAAKLIAESGESPVDMRKKVTSKKGTTEAALNAMYDSGFKKAVSAGFTAARLRSDELGK